MQDYAHIFTPSDLSLNERIKSYRQIVSDYRSVQESQHHTQNTEWVDTLGSEEEVDIAFEVISRSLNMAIGAFDANKLGQSNIKPDQLNGY